METLELIKRARAGDKLARDQVIRDNMALVYSIVARFGGRGYEMEDLGQIGAIGLIKAVNTYRADKKIKLTTYAARCIENEILMYAVPMITGEIKRFLRDDGAIKVSRSLKENGWKAKKKEQELSLKLGRNPTMEELCESLAMKREEVVMAMDAVSEVDSLYKTLYQKEGSEILLVDKIQSKKDESEEVLNRITLEKLLQELAGRERALIQKRYFEEKTQVQVAKELEMSQVQVSRLEKKILASMRKKIIFHSV